jgi:hypothetical protein
MHAGMWNVQAFRRDLRGRVSAQWWTVALYTLAAVFDRYAILLNDEEAVSATKSSTRVSFQT